MKLLLFGWLLLVSSVALAQTPRPDVLYKIDRTSVNVKIDELTDTDIVYFEPLVPKVKKTLARSQVWKIVFSDGSVEVITALPGDASTTDQITLIDQTTVQGKVSRRDERKLYYTKPNDATNTQYELLLSRLDRIQYADGHEEKFGKLPSGNASANQVVTQTQPVTTAAPIAGDTKPKSISSADYSVPGASASYDDPAAFARIHLTVGPEFAYYPDMLNKDKAWLNDSTGFGMKNNIGVSLRFDYQFSRKLALSVTAGYYGWELVRKYTRDGISEYEETKRLTQIPVQLGLKVYLVRSFYLLPGGGVNLLFSSVKTSDNHPTPANESVQSTPVTYGATLGYEIRAKTLLLDFSVRYQILSVNMNYTEFRQSLSEQVNIASIRLGIGFNSFKK